MWIKYRGKFMNVIVTINTNATTRVVKTYPNFTWRFFPFSYLKMLLGAVHWNCNILFLYKLQIVNFFIKMNTILIFQQHIYNSCSNVRCPLGLVKLNVGRISLKLENQIVDIFPDGIQGPFCNFWWFTIPDWGTLFWCYVNYLYLLF